MIGWAVLAAYVTGAAAAGWFAARHYHREFEPLDFNDWFGGYVWGALVAIVWPFWAVGYALWLVHKARSPA